MITLLRMGVMPVVGEGRRWAPQALRQLSLRVAAHATYTPAIPGCSALPEARCVPPWSGRG